jgi:hypothetical protein
MRLTFSGRYRWLLVGTGMLVMMMLASACAGVPSTTTNTTTATSATTTASGTTSGASQPTATQQATISVPGSIQFIGPINSVNASTIVVQMPDGPLTMSITSQTDRSHYKTALPTAGQIVKVETSASNGSFIATKLEPADAKDATKQNTVDYQGETTSAVGPDNVLHLGVGSKIWNLTIKRATDLDKFNHNAQSIQAHQRVKVKVQFAGTNGTVLKVDTDNGNS